MRWIEDAKSGTLSIVAGFDAVYQRAEELIAQNYDGIFVRRNLEWCMNLMMKEDGLRFLW